MLFKKIKMNIKIDDKQDIKSSGKAEVDVADFFFVLRFWYGRQLLKDACDLTSSEMSRISANSVSPSPNP